MMHYPKLLSPLEIGPLRLSNRIVFPPMVISMARDDGLAGQAHVDHYRGVEGPGLVIVEGVAVSREGRINRRQLTIDTDHHIDGLARLARVIHENGSVAGIQLHHAGATALSETRKWKYVRVTRILARLAAQQLWIGHLRQIRRPFVEGARRAVEAGFDLIEVHGAHGYLFTQFLSPIKNWRIDGYGGSIENRSRLLLEVISDVDAAVGKSAVVTCRLGVADGRRGGLPVSDGISVAVALEKSGMRVLDVSSGSGTPANVRPVDSPFSARLHLAKLVKSAVSIPVIGNMGIRHPQMAEEALEAGMADLIAVGRGILADPLWARKVIDGNPESILECRECRPCFFHSNGLKCPTRKKMVVSNQRSDT